MSIPFSDLNYIHNLIRAELRNEFEEVLSDNSFILGDKLKNFEQAYSQFNNVSFTLGVSNGMDAIFLSLKALEIGEGDEVIIPSNTFIATALAVSHTGAKPVFAEPFLDTYNINPQNILSRITSKTKAIIPVHLYGQAAKMDEIMEIARKKELFVIEDNAQAQGSVFNGQITGSLGHLNATSFYPGKNLGALGDAGAITTNDNALFERVRLLRNYGSIEKYNHEVLGYNMRLDELQASFLTIKLKHLNNWIQSRVKIANFYNEKLNGIEDLHLPVIQEGAGHVFHLYVIRTKYRDLLQDFLKTEGIQTLIHYPIPIHLQKAYKQLEIERGSLPIAEEISNTSLSLPIWVGMTDDHLEEVTSAIQVFFHNRR